MDVDDGLHNFSCEPNESWHQEGHRKSQLIPPSTAHPVHHRQHVTLRSSIVLPPSCTLFRPAKLLHKIPRKALLVQKSYHISQDTFALDQQKT